MMPKSTWCWICIALGIAATSADICGAVEDSSGRETPEGTCLHGDEQQDAMISLRQLRTAGLRVNVEEEPEASPRVEDLIGLGVPGGWGEAAYWADLVKASSAGDWKLLTNNKQSAGRKELPDEPMVGASAWLRDGLVPKSRLESGTCVEFGCNDSYIPGQSCQCTTSCEKYGNCCMDVEWTCKHIYTLYHQTSEEVGPIILNYGFRPGHKGWCGGGIYFATTPQGTDLKAIGPDSHKGFYIEAKVAVGRVLYLEKECIWNMTGETLRAMNYDSIGFNPGDGPEYVLYSKERVLSMKRYFPDYTPTTTTKQSTSSSAPVEEAEEETTMTTSMPLTESETDTPTAVSSTSTTSSGSDPPWVPEEVVYPFAGGF